MYVHVCRYIDVTILSAQDLPAIVPVEVASWIPSPVTDKAVGEDFSYSVMFHL